MASAAFQAPQRPYATGGRKLKGSASMDSFVDFGLNGEDQLRPPNHRKGFSSPLSLFKNRKKSSADVRDKSDSQLSNVRSAESLNVDLVQSSSKHSHRALPALPLSEPTSASSASSNSSGPQGTYAPLRMSPEANASWQPQILNPTYEGLPYRQQSLPLHANHGPPVVYPNESQQMKPQAPAEGAMDTALQKHGQAILDESQMLDRNAATDVFVAEGLQLSAPHHESAHKQSIDSIKKMTMGGAEHLKAAEDALDAFAASAAWTEGKDIAETLMEPAKDMVQIFDVITPYVPMLIIAKAVFVVIVQKEMDKRQNEQNLQLCILGITKFWYTLCDVNVIFNVKPESKGYQDLHELVQNVADKMHEFGNFQNLYYKHGHLARAMRSTAYKTQIAAFLDTFKDFQDQLQRLLTQVSALTINKIEKTADQMDRKLDIVMSMLLKSQSPAEESIQAKIAAYGGEEKAFQDKRFFNEMSEFGIKSTPQLRSILREDLNSQLKENEAIFKLQVDETKRDLQQVIGHNTDILLEKMDSGPHELIEDEDIRQIWKDMKWRLSCKTRHFIDALHHHYAHKFSRHRKETGEVHPEQWTLKFIGRVIFQPTIGDAIDSDGSGYVSIDEVNRFTAHRGDWSVPIFLAHAAAGWYLNALYYRSRCMDALSKIQRGGKRMLPQNRKNLRPYFQNGCLPEIWYIVDSLNTESLKYQQEDMRFQFEKLAPYRQRFMQITHKSLQHNLENVRYRLEGTDDVKAVVGTSRTEAVVLPLLMILLERHSWIIETAHNFILAEMELQDMITSLSSVASAFGKRYSILTEGWRQLRFDIPLQISYFGYGIFVNWHTHFSTTSYDQEYPELHQDYIPEDRNPLLEARGPGPAKELLTYALPVQPSPEELRRPRLSLRTRNLKRDDARAKERYGNLVQRVKSKRSNRLSGNVPKSPATRSPIVRIEGDSHKLLEPSSATLTPTHHKQRNSQSSYQFEFEDPDGVLHAINNDGYASVESLELPDISYTKSKILTLDDRIRAVEEELSGMKNMLSQLLALSKQNGE